MPVPLYTCLYSLDTWCEQEPPEAFRFPTRGPLPPAISAAEWAVRMIADGYWLYRMGTWCPDENATLVWNDQQIVGNDDEPLGWQLQNVGVQVRSLGCQLVADLADPIDHDRLRSACPTSYPADLWNAVITLAEHLEQQKHAQQDWFGMPLPLSIEDLSDAAAASTLYGRQGDTSVVTTITLGRQSYFVKQCYQPNAILYHYPAFQAECAVSALFRCLPGKLGPQTSVVYVGTHGQLVYLSQRVPGVIMSDIRKAASRVSLAAVQAAVIAEYLVSAQDRHHANALIDRHRAQPWLIDFAHSFDDEPDQLDLPSPQMPLAEQRMAFTRALWSWHPDRMLTATGETLILPDILPPVIQAREALMHTLHQYALPAEAIQVVTRRLDQLERLTQHPEEAWTLEHLNRT